MSNDQQPASASAMPNGVTDPNYRPEPGRLGNLSVPQQHTLDKFRKEIQDEGWFVPERMDDAMLLRCVVLCAAPVISRHCVHGTTHDARRPWRASHHICDGMTAEGARWAWSGEHTCAARGIV